MKTDVPVNRRRGGLARQSGLTSIAAAAAILSGLLLDVSIAATFGAGSSTDAFFVGARIPIGLVAIVMVGANQALVPAIATWLVRKTESETWRLVSHLLTATLLIGGAICGLVAFAAWPLMRATAPGLNAHDVALAASVARAMFLVVPLVAAAEVLRALLNARYSFVAPAAMNVVMNGLAAALVMSMAHRHDVRLVAWAYVAGALAQFVFMFGMAIRRGFRYRPGMPFGDADVRATGRLCARPLLGASLNPLARIGEQLFVSFLPPGSITILNYGYRLISAIGGSVFFRSVIVALVPRLTEATARGDEKVVAETTRNGLRIMTVLAIPLTAFMAVLAKPAALVLFRRGHFSRSDAGMLGVVLAVYASSLVGSGVQRALLAPFFAKLDTRTPLRNTAYGILANLVLLAPLVLPFGRRNAHAIIGVALAYSIAQYVNVVHAWYRMRSLGIRLTGVWSLGVKLAVATSVSAAVMIAGAHYAGLERHLHRWILLARTAAVGVAGAAVLGIVMVAIAWPDVKRSFRGMRRKPAGAVYWG